MKAAYLAYDRNSLVGLSVLANYFEQVDFYLVDQERKPESTPFSDVSIKTDHVMIPAEEDLRTSAQVHLLKSMQEEFKFYREQLSVNFRKSPNIEGEVQKSCRTEINSLELIKDVVFNTKTNEIYVEREKMGVTAYQYLFVEDHQIMAENFAGFATNIFKFRPINSHIWFAAEFNYELQKPRNGNLGRKEFVLVKDRQNRSILDNWYFIRTFDHKIVVHQWVPFNQFKNSDFQKFIVERIEKLLKEKLELLHLTQFNQFYVNSASGFATQGGALRHSKISSALPSFHFWPQEKINRYLYTKLDMKMKEINKFQLTQQNLRG